MSSEKINENSFINEVENYVNENGEFDYVKDFYVPIQETEELYASPNLKLMYQNGIDPWEYLGEAQVEGTGPIYIPEEPKEIEENKKGYTQVVFDFVKDLPEALFLSTAEAMLNLGNNAVQIAGTGANFLFKDTFDTSSVNEFAQSVNDGVNQQISKFDAYRKANDVNGIANFLSEVGVDIAAAYPIEKMLRKTGLPSYLSVPLSFGIAYGSTGGTKDAQNNLFIDSQVINRTNELLRVLPNTPEAKVSELVANTFEGTAWGVFGERLTKVFKFLKNNLPALQKQTQQGSVSVGGAAASGAGADTIQGTGLADTEKKIQSSRN